MDLDVMWLVIAAGIVLWFTAMLWRQRSVRGAHENDGETRNPYHAVAIRVRGKGCDMARRVVGKRFLSSEAPMLPLSGCSSPVCSCKYVHFDDRRHYDRRGPHPIRGYGGDDRRFARGRRLLDGLELSPGP